MFVIFTSQTAVTAESEEEDFPFHGRNRIAGYNVDSDWCRI